MNEQEIRSIQQGGSQGFARLYERMAEPALRCAAAIVGHDGVAADAVQETFLRVYRNLSRFDSARPFEPWFYRILVNECRRVRRWRGRLLPTGTVPDGAAASADYDALYEAIGALDRTLREPLVFRYLMGYKDNEVAEILGIPLTAAKGRVKRAKTKLRSFLKEG